MQIKLILLIASNVLSKRKNLIHKKRKKSDNTPKYNINAFLNKWWKKKAENNNFLKKKILCKQHNVT